MERYLGLDVHARSCTLAVISKAGKKLKDVVIETNGQALIEAIRTIRGRKHLCLEEGTQSAWLYEILQPHVHELVVTTVPKSRGKKSEKADAYQRAEELLRGTIDRRVFKSPQTYARLRELARSHQTTVRDRVRVQARLKTIYRSRGIPSGGPALYGVRRRGEWFEKLPEPCQRRALHLYTQLDFLVEQERKIEAELLEELSKHRMAKVLQTCPGLGPIRVARLLPIVITPHRFRTRQQFWSYGGLGIVMRSSSDWIQTPDKKWQRAWVQQTRGLSKQHNAELKAIFKRGGHHGDHPAHRNTDEGGLPSDARQRHQAQPGQAHTGTEDRSDSPAHVERRGGLLQRASTPSDDKSARLVGQGIGWEPTDSRPPEAQTRERFGGEHPCLSWSMPSVGETPGIGYAPPKYRRKRWPHEALMGGWYLHFAEYFDADRSPCADNESKGSAVLNPRTSRVRNRRPDPRLRGDTGEIGLAILPYGREFKRVFRVLTLAFPFDRLV